MAGARGSPQRQADGGRAPAAAAANRGKTTQDLTLREAQRLIDAWMRERGWAYWHPLAQLARLTEELGELARLVNHLYGEKPKRRDEAEQELGLELADLLYTMICLANSQGVDLQAALEQALDKYRARDSHRYGALGPAGSRIHSADSGARAPGADEPA